MKKIFLLLIVLLNISTLYSLEYLSEKSETLDVYFEKLEDGGYVFYGDNRHFIPQYVNLGFTTLKNLQMDRENPSQVVLESGAKKVLLATLTPIQKAKSYSFRSRLTYANGDPLTVQPDDFVYLFPFEHGKKFKLDQGFGGTFSHKNENYYALDFSMDVGTPVSSARSGVVIEVKEDSNRGGASSTYASYGNYISIYHSDGTIANYVHLKKNGSIVSVGDKVGQGEVIGYSGNTGLSTGPHLHFSVNIPKVNGVSQSIPIKLIGLEGESLDPIVGNYYYSTHPGEEEFVATFGKDILDSDYDDYLVSVPKSDTLKFRDESIDSTTIIFCRNGYDDDIKGKFKFKLQNSITSKQTQIELVIPALSEVYICLIRPKVPGKQSGFSYSISYSVLE